MVVRSLTEAKEWFDANTDGLVECIRDDGAKITASTFHEAHLFYEPPQLGAEIAAPQAIGGTRRLIRVSRRSRVRICNRLLSSLSNFAPRSGCRVTSAERSATLFGNTETGL